MGETTRDQLAEMLLNNAERENISKPLNDAIHKLDRLARIEQACLLRSEIDAPEWATRWIKPGAMGYGDQEWIGEHGGWDLAPDLRPDEPGPITLPIIDA